MKLPHHHPILLLLSLLCVIGTAWELCGQSHTFDSGSDGSYGRIYLEALDETIDLPPDGILHCTSVFIQLGTTLRFNRNQLNTPVYILATGDVEIAGTIDVSGSAPVEGVLAGGRGGPGGFDGGKPGYNDALPGDGYGPGAGRGGTTDYEFTPYAAGGGSYGSVGSSGVSTNKGSVYGSPLLIPLIGGSGGGGIKGSPGRGGGGGGGAILIASSTRIVFEPYGKILAQGAGEKTAGSGGAVRLVAPVVAANSTASSAEINVHSSTGYGGMGRIRVDSIDRSDLRLVFSPNSAASIGSTMVVFPNPTPRLDIVELADIPIPEGSGPVSFVLTPPVPDPLMIAVQARDFPGTVNAAIVYTPDSGNRIIQEVTIPNNLSNPRILRVPANPLNSDPLLNVPVTVNVWTR